MLLDNWVVLLVRTASTGKMLRVLKKRLDCTPFTPFVPTKEEILKKNGVWVTRVKPLFSGYIFVRTQAEPNDIAVELNKLLVEQKKVGSFIHLLHYGNDKKNVVIRKRERILLEQLMNSENCVESSTGRIVDGEIEITGGALRGLEYWIKNIDRHQRRAVVDVEFAGELCEIRLSLEITEKI